MLEWRCAILRFDSNYEKICLQLDVSDGYVFNQTCAIMSSLDSASATMLSRSQEGRECRCVGPVVYYRRVQGKDVS